MPIRKSYLEQKWYYRVAKVFFLLLPLLIALIVFLNGEISICYISQKNILDILQKNIVYVAIGLVLYYLILIGIWRCFLYIAFGGLEDDAKNKDDNQPAPIRSKRTKIIQLIPVIIILGVAAIYLLSEMGYITLPKINLDSFESLNVKSTITPKSTTPKSTCPATSAQTGTPCRSVKNGIGVSGIIVPASCNCPSDTAYAGMDNISSGGPYKICSCK